MSQLMLMGSRMALCRASGVAGRATGRSMLVQHTGQPVRHSTTSMESVAAKFFEKHAKRGSPQSPYMLGLTYKFQMTSLLSITHRLTGLGLGLAVYGMGLASLSMPSLSYEMILKKTKELVPESLITAYKFVIASSFTFHAFNGIRHLFWDAGYGFALKNLYKSGYAVLAITFIGMANMIWKYFEN